MPLPLPSDASAGPELATEYAAAAPQAHLSDAEVYDAVAVVGLVNLATRSALATGITVEDDLP